MLQFDATDTRVSNSYTCIFEIISELIAKYIVIDTTSLSQFDSLDNVLGCIFRRIGEVKKYIVLPGNINA